MVLCILQSRIHRVRVQLIHACSIQGWEAGLPLDLNVDEQLSSEFKTFALVT